MELDHLAQSFSPLVPEQLSFYDVGSVNRDSAPMEPESASRYLKLLGSDQSVWLFQIQGDFQGWISLLYPPGLSPSLYAELGNVITARWIDAIFRKEGLWLEMSPPLVFGIEKLQAAIALTSYEIWHYHLTLSDGSQIPLRVIVALAPAKGVQDA